MHWNVINCTIAFFIFIVAAFAETNRLPFDLPEAESELIAGYHSEYSAMKFSMFFIAEYANMMTASALMATLFFGGWDIPFTLWDNVAPHTLLKTLLTLGVLLARRSCSSSSSSSGSAGRCRASATTSSCRSAGSSCCRRRSAYIVVVAGATLGARCAGIHADSIGSSPSVMLVAERRAVVHPLRRPRPRAADQSRVFAPRQRESGQASRARYDACALRARTSDRGSRLMAIGVKVLERPIEETSYVRATLKGMALTLKHLLDPEKVTIQYPEEKDGDLAALARHASHAHDGRRQGEVRRLRSLSDGLSGELHQARAGRGRARATAIRSCSRSTSSAASSAATARKSARKRRFTSAGTTRTLSTAAKGSSTTSSG